MSTDTRDRVTPLVPAPIDTEPLRTFTVALVDPTSPNALGDHLITDSYIEERWLRYIGPLSWAIARRCARLISNSQDQTMTVKIKEWCCELGETDGDAVLCAFSRLVRWGLATWDPIKGTLAMRRRWPDVSPTVETPEHRAALLAIVDRPLAKEVKQ